MSEDVVKALECCNDGACEYCPFAGNDCVQKARKEAIDLINRQKAEIEKINVYCENLEISQNHLLNELATARKKAKSEAIKEFAHFLIDKAKNGVVSVADIPDYVCELVEGSESDA